MTFDTPCRLSYVFQDFDVSCSIAVLRALTLSRDSCAAGPPRNRRVRARTARLPSGDYGAPALGLRIARARDGAPPGVTGLLHVACARSGAPPVRRWAP
eukprot:9098705-Alexandrium_andersonii.AAC.1